VIPFRQVREIMTATVAALVLASLSFGSITALPVELLAARTDATW
jgi:hypothetical protein